MASLYDMVMMGGPGDVTTGDIAARMPPAPGRARSLADYLGGMQGALPRGPLQAGRRLYNDPSLANALMFGLSMAPGQPLELTKMGLGTVGMGADAAANVVEGYEQGDPWRVAGGVGQGLLTAATLAPVGRVGTAMFGSLPRAAATGFGIGATTHVGREGLPHFVSDAQAQTPGHEIQKQLKLLGLYAGPIDGNVGPGTRKAMDAYRESRGLGPGDDIMDRLRLETDPAYKAEIEARQREGEALKLKEKEAETKRIEAEAQMKGIERARTLDKAGQDAARDANTWGRFAYNVAPHVLGTVLGAGARKAVTGIFNRTNAAAVAEAERTAGTLPPPGTLTAKGRRTVQPSYTDDTAPADMSAINTFYTRGGADVMPYPGITAMPRTGRPNPADLYEANAKAQNAINYGIYGAAAIDTGVFQGLAYKARKEADEAAARYRESKLEVDLREQVDKSALADWYGFIGRMGPAAGVGYGLTSKFAKFKDQRPSQDAVRRVDEASIRLDNYLRNRNGPAALPPPGPPGGNPGNTPGGQLIGPGGAGPGNWPNPQPGRDRGGGGGPSGPSMESFMQKEGRDLLRKDLDAGRLPDISAFTAIANQKGVTKIPKAMEERFYNLSNWVNRLKAGGMDNATIARTLYDAMQKGGSGLPAIAVGAGLTASQWPSDQ